MQGTLSRDELDDMRERILAIGGHHLDGQVLATNIAHLDAAIEQLDGAIVAGCYCG